MARILLVDDDDDGVAIRQLVLERLGHEVSTATDCATARRQFKARPPEIVIMDLRLPDEGDGAALIRDFRDTNPKCRIIVLSGATGDLKGQPEAAMVDTVLRKPAKTERLVNAISKLA